MKRIVIAGASGLVGKALVPALLERGYAVQALSRNPRRADFPPSVTLQGWSDLPQALEGSDALINLAGANIGERRWTSSRKVELFESRVGTTKRLVDAMRGLRPPPALLVQASAVGWYGDRGEESLDEESPGGSGFLAELCRAWEASALQASGSRVLRLRLGTVLSREGGALPPLLNVYRGGFGASLGSGKQGFSWIHIQDLVALILNALESESYEGVLNATAPHPCSQDALARTLAALLHRPCWPIPSFLTRMGVLALLGERGEALLLQGAYVHPQRALSLGFQFRFPDLNTALQDLVEGQALRP